MKKFLIVFLIVAVVLGGLAIYAGIKLVSGLKNKAGDFVAGKVLSTVSRGNVKVQRNGKEISINGVEIQSGLPDNFPKDFPMHPDTEVTSSIGKGNTSTTTASVKTSVQKVYDFYIKKLPENGWEVKEKALGELKVLELKKGGITGHLTLTAHESDTTMLISFKE